MALPHRHDPVDFRERQTARHELKDAVAELRTTIDALKEPGLTSARQLARLTIAVPRSLRTLIKVIRLLAGR